MVQFDSVSAMRQCESRKNSEDSKAKGIFGGDPPDWWSAEDCRGVHCVQLSMTIS